MKAKPITSAFIRSSPEDFQVDEIPAFTPTGEGEHLLLDIQKRDTNTTYVAKALATWAGVADMAVSYAGLKDRHAVTTQRFSVHLPKRIAPSLDLLQLPGVQVLNSQWHNRKLQRGALAGNRFTLVLREVQGDKDEIEICLNNIVQRGVPNWFGEQRFGRDGGNIQAALDMFAGKRVRREQRSIYLSAARSTLFNQVLAARVEQDNWDKGLEGEVWMLNGTHSVFGPEPWNDTLATRLAEMDIHPTAPLWGVGELRSTDACAALEITAITDEQSQALRTGLEQAGLKQERRSLRLKPENLNWQWLETDVLELTFALPAGTYATTVLQGLGEIQDANRLS